MERFTAKEGSKDVGKVGVGAGAESTDFCLGWRWGKTTIVNRSV